MICTHYIIIIRDYDAHKTFAVFLSSSLFSIDKYFFFTSSFFLLSVFCNSLVLNPVLHVCWFSEEMVNLGIHVLL